MENFQPELTTSKAEQQASDHLQVKSNFYLKKYKQFKVEKLNLLINLLLFINIIKIMQKTKQIKKFRKSSQNNTKTFQFSANFTFFKSFY